MSTRGSPAMDEKIQKKPGSPPQEIGWDSQIFARRITWTCRYFRFYCFRS